MYFALLNLRQREGVGFQMQRRAITLAVTTDYSTSSFLLYIIYAKEDRSEYYNTLGKDWPSGKTDWKIGWK